MNNLLGVDCGQASDPAAWALLERRIFTTEHPVSGTWQPRTTNVVEMHCTAYSRFQLRTPYTEMVRKLATIVSIPDLCSNITLIIDCSRERAVFDIIKERNEFRNVNVVPIVIGSGTHVNRDAYGWFAVPEYELLSALTVALESERLKTSREGGQEEGDTEALNEQLTHIKRRVSRRGRSVSMSVDGTDVDHDDLAFAIAMPLWYAKYTGAFALGVDEGAAVEKPKEYDPLRWGLEEK